jgi:polysaccharide export outer membrane protein
MDTTADWNMMAGTTVVTEESCQRAMTIEAANRGTAGLIILLTLAVLFLCSNVEARDGATQAGNSGAAASSAAKAGSDPGTAAQVKPHDDSFVIGPDDVLSISVWKEPDVSRSVPVRSDGKISLPLAGEVQAGGTTPRQLEKAIAAKLQSYISEPEVTVIVQQINSQKFNILGLVSKPGAYPLTNSATVLDAIALAGGFRDFAKQKSIYILRQNPDGSQTRIPFNYKDVIKGKNVEQNIRLQPRDTIVVP